MNHAPGIQSETRRDFLKTLGASGAACAALPGRTARAMGGSGTRRGQPNIIYLFSDEHRYQSMSFTEMEALRTPNMERMAREGTSFEFALSNNPVCVPYRCMLLSGQWPHRTGAVDNQGGLASWDATLGHVFRDAGYVTGYTGKWHAGGFPHLAGFDWHMHWGNTDDHWDSHWTDLHGDNQRRECTTYNATAMTDQALEFIDANTGGGKPFFLMVSWNPPHYIFTDAPEGKIALYPDEEALPWRGNANPAGRERWWPDYQGYHAHITAIDKEIGRVYAHLERMGLLDDTIVIYTSDHGSMMNSHGLGNKRHPHDESCRVPFLVTGPGVPRGQVRRELFGAIDIFPTLCGLAGIGVPSFCDGHDSSANIRNRPGAYDPETQLLMHVTNARGVARDGRVIPSREDVLGYHTMFHRSVRSRRFTYVMGAHGVAALWDNVNDPLQQRNLAGDPAYAGIQRDLRQQLDQWLAKAEDPFIHAAYREMPLPDRIFRQAADGATALPLHHIIMRLRLSPEQFAELPALHNRYYDRRGMPLDRAPGNARSRAAIAVANEILPMLDGEQEKQMHRWLAIDPLTKPEFGSA